MKKTSWAFYQTNPNRSDRMGRSRRVLKQIKYIRYKTNGELRKLVKARKSLNKKTCQSRLRKQLLGLKKTLPFHCLDKVEKWVSYSVALHVNVFQKFNWRFLSVS